MSGYIRGDPSVLRTKGRTFCLDRTHTVGRFVMAKRFTTIDERVFISMDLTALDTGKIHWAYPLKKGTKTDGLAEKIGIETIQLYYCYYRS